MGQLKNINTIDMYQGGRGRRLLLLLGRGVVATTGPDVVRISPFTSDMGVSGADMTREDEPERDDDEPILLGARRFGGGTDAVNEGA